MLGDSVIVSPTEPVGNDRRKVWFRKGKNLFDKSKALLGYWISNEQGDIAKADDDVFITDFIPVFKNVPVYIPATGTARRQFYNKNKVGITYLNNSKAQVFTPIEDGFIRVTCVTSTVTMDSLMIYYGTTETEYEAYIEPKIYIKNSYDVYEEFMKKEDNKIILYENQDGNNGYEIELLDTVEKCVEVEIYGIGDNNIRIYQKILDPNQATFEMSSEVMYEGTEYINKALCAFINNKFYKYQDREYKIDVTSANVRNVTTSNWLKIVKIVGILN